MRKIIISLIFIAVAAYSFCQQTPSSDYTLKSKHQKTAAWIMLSGGAALAVTGVAVSASNWESSGGDVLLIIGGAAMVSSIPLFIASGKNKKRSMSASIRMERAPVMLLKKDFANHSFPAALIQISL